MQDNWQWCSRCMGLAYFGNSHVEVSTTETVVGIGACPAGGEHDHSGSGNYALASAADGLAGQNNWSWCVRCQGLYFIGNGSHGQCPAGGPHAEEGSGDYVLTSADPGQHGWRWCARCQGLFFSGDGSLGVCPAGGPHSTAGSGDYVLTIVNAPAAPPPVSSVAVTSPSVNNFLVSWNVDDAVLPLVETFEVWETTGPFADRFIGFEFPTGGTLRYSKGVSESDLILTDHCFTVYIRNDYGRSLGVRGCAHNTHPAPPPPPPTDRTTLTATLTGDWQMFVTPNTNGVFVEIFNDAHTPTPLRVSLSRSGANWSATVPARDGPPGNWAVTFHVQGVFGNGEPTGDVQSPSFPFDWSVRGIAITVGLDSAGTGDAEWTAPMILNE